MLTGEAEKTRRVAEKKAKLKLEAEAKQFKEAMQSKIKGLEVHVNE